MSYFKKFPPYLATLSFQGATASSPRVQKQVVITDFFRRIRTGKGFTDVVVGIVPYVIKDGDTPEKLAYDFYGSAFYHWVVLLVNDIVDSREEWPMDGDSFALFMDENYADPNATHHYIDPVTEFEVDSDFSGAVPVTNIEYEETRNNDKRNIKMLDSQYLQQFVSTFDTLIRK